MDSSSSGGDSSPPQKKTKSDGKESGKKVGRPKGRSNLPVGTYSVSKTCQKMTPFFGLPRKGLEGEEKMDEDEELATSDLVENVKVYFLGSCYYKDLESK